jgi:hypothetical protein
MAEELAVEHAANQQYEEHRATATDWLGRKLSSSDRTTKPYSLSPSQLCPTATDKSSRDNEEVPRPLSAKESRQSCGPGITKALVTSAAIGQRKGSSESTSGRT